jgi:hypothetical protein
MYYHNVAAGVKNDTLMLSDRSVGSSVVRERREKRQAEQGKTATREEGSGTKVQVIGFAHELFDWIGKRVRINAEKEAPAAGDDKAGGTSAPPCATIKDLSSHVVIKMDIEKMEFAVLSQMLRTGVFALVDDLLLECHYNTNKPARLRDASKDIGKDDCDHLVKRFNDVLNLVKGSGSEGGAAPAEGAGPQQGGKDPRVTEQPFVAVLWNSVKTAKASGYIKKHGGFYPT